MTYVPVPTDPTQPTDGALAGYMAAEFRALKGYIQTLLSGTPNYAALGGFRNRLDNGDFSVAQRGTSPTQITAGNAGYCLDRWILYTTGANASMYQVVDGPDSENYSAQLLQAAGGTSLQMYQRIESLNCQDFVVGKQLTLSGFIQCSSTGVAAPSVITYTPTAIDNYAAVSVAAAAVALPAITLANSWQYFSVPITLTTDCTKGLQIGFSFTTGLPAATPYLFAFLQLEPGNFASGFEFRHPQVTLGICQRYYQLGQITVLGYGQAGGSVGGNQNPSTPMRIVPAVAYVAQANINIASYTYTPVGSSPPGNIQIVGVLTVTAAFVLNVSYSLSAEL